MYYTYPCVLERIPRQYVKYKVKFDFSVSFRFSVETKNNRVLTDFPLHSSLLRSRSLCRVSPHSTQRAAAKETTYIDDYHQNKANG